MSDESLQLSEVHAAFREAERKFAELASAASELQTVSSQLSDARSSVLEAGGQLAELAEANRAVSEQLAGATSAIEATDPAEIQSRLREVIETLEEQARAFDGALGSLGADLRRRIRLLTILTVVVFAAVVVVAVLTFAV